MSKNRKDQDGRRVMIFADVSSRKETMKRIRKEKESTGHRERSRKKEVRPLGGKSGNGRPWNLCTLLVRHF